MQVFILTAWLALMIGMLALAIKSIQTNKQAGQTRLERLRNAYRNLQKYKTHSQVSRLAHTSPGYAGLWHQLLLRVNFDIALAEKLVKQLRLKYPGKPDRWYIGKAIWDIEKECNRH
ncbi:hypothetical protein NIES4072_64030 [Nostoc commune NIES-4072]|uniref:Uncharacterized protein n=1 Tax=Nostoc commune NIES-4072 TaxID=2005467 RepID=A0A2R5G3R1_NOSCO|nr:hypothetical protein [Nostoc commune]BBD66328.1 hypothetical protein NIES4070_26930 [Nostoc commune HK-02]GBG22691.1 hypothetical protein NIES4072_64030 [Nostoc commune NIES-4072]